jgi:uncharacterized RDD family membrane protein YckC
MKRASLAARFFALVIDMAFLWSVSALTAVSIVVGHSAGAGRVSSKDVVATVVEGLITFLLFGIFLFLFYFTYLTAHGESTLGKSVFKLKVVRRRDEGNLEWGRAFVRACCYAVSAFPFFLGFFVALLLKGRALHDMLAGTEVAREE